MSTRRVSLFLVLAFLLLPLKARADRHNAGVFAAGATALRSDLRGMGFGGHFTFPRDCPKGGDPFPCRSAWGVSLNGSVVWGEHDEQQERRTQTVTAQVFQGVQKGREIHECLRCRSMTTGIIVRAASLQGWEARRAGWAPFPFLPGSDAADIRRPAPGRRPRTGPPVSPGPAWCRPEGSWSCQWP